VENCANLFGRKTRQKAGAEPAAVPVEGNRAGARLPAMRVCSACAGDYEDLDRTGWAPDEMDHDACGLSVMARRKSFLLKRKMRGIFSA